MPSGDSRKDFVLATTGNYFGIAATDAAIANNQDDSALNTFLDDGNSPVLAARLDGKNVTFLNKVESGESNEKVIVFFKVKPDVITPDNLHTNVFVSSMLDSPVSALYHAVQKVFVPVLLKDEKWSRTFDPKLQNLLSELEAGLGSVIRKQDPSIRRTGDQKEDNFGGILTPTDEFQYWAETALSGSKMSIKERAQHIQELFQPIARDYGGLDTMSLMEVMELVELTQDTLDEVWKQTEHDPPYPEARMKHLLDVIAGSLGRYVQQKLSEFDLWKGPYGKVKEALRSGLAICERWAQACETLTTQFWKRYGPHPWKGEKFVPENIVQLAERLEEIKTLRSVHEQLLRLLSSSDQQELRVSEAFTPFAGLNPLQYNPYTVPLWKAAVAQYDRAMAPAEQRIAGKLRNQFRGLEGNSQQMLREFQRYKELIKRPSLSKELITERETLLGQLTVFIKQTRDDFTRRTSHGSGSGGPPKGKNLPETVNNIVWVRQLEAKVEGTLKTGESLLGDLNGFRNFRRDGTELLEELQNWRQDTFDEWSRDIQAQIDDPKQPLSLETNGRLMELNHNDGKLHVNYGERLVTLLREVRNLTALGFPIPAKILHVAAVGQKFYRHGVILKQVAHFYNTIDQQMIPCQQAMMLDSALAFERLIKNPKTGSKSKGDQGVQVTWDNPDELEAYIHKLQAAGDKLSTENRKLRKSHYTVCDKVVTLMGVDLLRQQQKWKDGLMEIRHLMAGLVSQGFSAANMKPWKAHWDRQLYKALEHQYQMGIEALNENLPEIKVELTYRQQKLQFRPPFEEIKAKYYREMKKFISIPNHFKGVNETADNLIYPAIIDRNAVGFTTCFRKADILFKRLASVLDKFKDWVVLGAVDLDEFVDQNLEQIADWERNFKALKARGRDAEKLPSEIKVDCIKVSTTPVKAVIDDHIQRLFDALLNSLRRAITNDVGTIDGFLNEAMETLSQRPQTVEEIGDANAKHSEFGKKKKVPTATLR